MTTLLVITTGRSDVQLAIEGARHEFDSKHVGRLHDAIEDRSWTVVDPPTTKKESKDALPDGDLTLCTPKLDAVLAWFDAAMPDAALIFETKRTTKSDPRFAGDVLERRLNDRSVSKVYRHAFLTGEQRLEDPSKPDDSVVRREIAVGLSFKIAETIGAMAPTRIVVATTGGLPNANELINELVRLHAVGGPNVTALEVPDGDRAKQDDRAVEEKFHPAAGYRARWHALSLVEKGNLLGAWGAVSHLKGAPGQEWTQVVQWLAHFASSLTLPAGCDLEVLRHQRMAVRAALRVELALRAGDIPRAVHGTVAFFEAALWDKLIEHFERDARDGRWLALRTGALSPAGNLLRDGGDDDKNRPFESKSRPDGQAWFWFHESGAGRFARDYVKSDPLKKLLDAVDKVKALRNDVAHNEPTPTLMNDARTRMQSAALWSIADTFLSQPLVQAVLKELGEAQPENLLANLLAEVRRRLVMTSTSAGGAP